MYYDRLSDLGIKLTRRGGQEKTTCPQCSDGRKNKRDKCLSVNIDNGEYNCHNCSWMGNVRRDDAKRRELITYERPTKEYLQQKFESEKAVRWFEQRGISKSTLDKFMIFTKQEWMPQTGQKENCICFPYFRDADMVNIKFRDGRKNFKMVSKAELILYNLNSLRGRRKAIIVEGECFHPNAEVLTENGWVSFENYKGENVAQYHENGYISFVEPLAIVCKEFDGNLLEYKNEQKFYSLTTPEHNFVFKKGIKFVKKKANDFSFRSGYHIPRVANHDGDGLELTDDQIRLCIAISADFTIREGGDLYCALKKDRKKERLCDILDRLNIPYTLNIDGRGYYSFFIRRGNRPEYIFKKFPHDWIYKTSQHQKNLIIDEILYWDGNSVPNRKQIEYSTAIYENAKFIQTIATLCGFTSTIIYRNNQFGDWMKVSILFNKKHTDTKSLKYGTKEIPYKGNVHCVTVPTGMILVRQNDCISVSGNCDTLAVYEAGFSQNRNPTHTEPDENGQVKEIADPLSEWAILSVPNGASKGSQRLEYLDNCSDWLLGVDEFIIATDGDEAGTQLRDEIMRRLGVERCKFAIYPTEPVVPTKEGHKRAAKDPNEVLLYLGKQRLIDWLFSAQSVPIDGVFTVEDIFESMLDNFRKGVQLAPTTNFKELDNFFRWKKGEINLWSGYANHGKTMFVLQLMLTKSIWDGWKWAVFSPENYPANDFYDDLIEMYNGKWLNQMTEDEYVLGAAFVNDHIFYVYPENEHDLVSIHEKFRYLVLKKGVDGVLIDPWNQLDHLQKPYQREDQYLSQALKDVKRFALLNCVSYNIIAHPKTPTYQEGKELPVVDMYDLYGGSMWGNKADQLVIYERPNWHINKSDPNIRIHVQKVKRKRTGGQHGEIDLRMDWSRKRYVEIPWENEPCDPVKAKYEKEREQKAIENGYGYEQKTLHLIESVNNVKPIKTIDDADDWGDQPF